MMKKYTFKSPNQQRIKSPKNSCRRPVFTNQWNSKRFHFDLEKAKRRLKNLPDLSKKLGNLPGNTIVEEFKMAKLEPSSKHEKVLIYYGLLNLKLDSIIIQVSKNNANSDLQAFFCDSSFNKKEILNQNRNRRKQTKNLTSLISDFEIEDIRKQIWKNIRRTDRGGDPQL